MGIQAAATCMAANRETHVKSNVSIIDGGQNVKWTEGVKMTKVNERWQMGGGVEQG